MRVSYSTKDGVAIPGHEVDLEDSNVGCDYSVSELISVLVSTDVMSLLDGILGKGKVDFRSIEIEDVGKLFALPPKKLIDELKKEQYNNLLNVLADVYYHFVSDFEPVTEIEELVAAHKSTGIKSFDEGDIVAFVDELRDRNLEYLVKPILFENAKRLEKYDLYKAAEIYREVSSIPPLDYRSAMAGTRSGAAFMEVAKHTPGIQESFYPDCNMVQEAKHDFEIAAEALRSAWKSPYSTVEVKRHYLLSLLYQAETYLAPFEEKIEIVNKLLKVAEDVARDELGIEDLGTGYYKRLPILMAKVGDFKKAFSILEKYFEYTESNSYDVAVLATLAEVILNARKSKYFEGSGYKSQNQIEYITERLGYNFVEFTDGHLDLTERVLDIISSQEFGTEAEKSTFQYPAHIQQRSELYRCQDREREYEAMQVIYMAKCIELSKNLQGPLFASYVKNCMERELSGSRAVQDNLLKMKGLVDLDLLKSKLSRELYDKIDYEVLRRDLEDFNENNIWTRDIVYLAPYGMKGDDFLFIAVIKIEEVDRNRWLYYTLSNNRLSEEYNSTHPALTAITIVTDSKAENVKYILRNNYFSRESFNGIIQAITNKGYIGSSISEVNARKERIKEFKARMPSNNFINLIEQLLPDFIKAKKNSAIKIPELRILDVNVRDENKLGLDFRIIFNFQDEKEESFSFSSTLVLNPRTNKIVVEGGLRSLDDD